MKVVLWFSAVFMFGFATKDITTPKPKPTVLWISAWHNHIKVQKCEGHEPPVITECDSPPEVGYGKAVEVPK